MQGVIVRIVTSEGLSDTSSASPKNSPSVNRAMRRLLPCTPLLKTSTCPWAMMKNLLRSVPSTISSLPSETSSVLKRPAMRAMMASGSLENSGTLRRASGINVATFPDTSISIRSAFGNSTLVRLTRYVPPLTCTHGSRLRSQRGVIDIILGDVFVVFARFEATDDVTLRCNRLSDIIHRADVESKWKKAHRQSNRPFQRKSSQWNVLWNALANVFECCVSLVSPVDLRSPRCRKTSRFRVGHECLRDIKSLSANMQCAAHDY